MSLLRVAVARINARNVDSVDALPIVPGAQRPEVSAVSRRGGNRYWIYSFGSPIEVTVDDAGSILTVDGSRTTVRIQSRRLPSLDVLALANAWAAREATAGTMGALSINDSTVASVGAARVRIEYGRPAVRGRTVWGQNGVLGDSIWRTGANSSTKFIVSAPVTVGGKRLDAGNYVLTTLAIPGRYHLIISQEGREVSRVPLKETRISPSVERFTIAIDGGLLRLRWDTLELSTPIT